MVTNEVRNYLKGLYGATPAPVNEEVRKQIIGDEKPITRRPADDIEPQMEQAGREIGIYLQKGEDVLSYAIFPQVAKKFLEERYAAKCNVDFNLARDNENNMGAKVYPL
jgi:oxaloacetate decarboxylase alpha subunit